MNTEEPVSLSELRGMTVMLFFWVSWQPGVEQVLPFMNLFNSRLGRSQGVYMMGVTDSDRFRVEEALKGSLVQYPVALESDSYKEYGISQFPRVVIIDRDGKVAYSGWPSGGLNELQNVAIELLAEKPPIRTHPEDAKVVRERLETAYAALREGDVRAAFQAGILAERKALTGDELKTECREVLDLVEALGRDVYEQAEQAVDERDWERAVDLYQRVVREYKDLDVSNLARRRIESLKGRYDEFAAVMEDNRDAQRAENVLGEALDLLRIEGRGMKEIGEAYEKLEQIVSDFEGTAAADKARTVMNRMQENLGVMNYVTDYKASGECELWLSQARSLVKMRRVGKARELYRTIIDTYPNTIWADIAAQELRGLP
jgi:signal transduction histidine kinase